LYNRPRLFGRSARTSEPFLNLALIRKRNLNSYLSATGLSTFAGLAGYSYWRLSNPDSSLVAAGLVAYAVALGLTVNRFGLRRSSRQIVIGIFALVGICVLGSEFFGLNSVLIPLLLSSGLSLLLIQVNRLWSIDRQLARRLLNSPIARQDSSAAADSRLISGLKLLNTVLPLNEAVVFHCLESDTLEPVVRFKGPAATLSDTRRNSVWRQGVDLCQQAAATAKLVSQTNNNSSSVAVPLLHEGDVAGVLLIRLASQFSAEDTQLLEAIGSQFARNLKRESFSKNTTRNQSFSYFSQSGNKRKLDALNVLKALTVEQRCEASALAHIDDGIAIAYLDGTLALVNPKLLSFVNITSEQASELDLFDLLNNFRTDVFNEPEIAVRRVLQSGADYEGELNIERKNQILNLRISLIRDKQNDDPIGIAIYIRDQTATKEYEKLKSDMISLMSHELRTPLTSINGFAELLTADETVPAQAREFVSIIANESQRMSRMINTFLSVTQLQRKDKQEVLKIPLRLDEVVRETIASLQPVAKKKRIRLIEQPAHRIPPVAADKSLITQAVKNLVNNAIKYSPERTTVTVSTALEAEAVRVCVEDRGFGIPAEAKERVWDKFYRVVREGQEKDEESTGLGLSFVREVVEQHGGSVDLDSQEGRGSKFSFTLPRL